MKIAYPAAARAVASAVLCAMRWDRMPWVIQSNLEACILSILSSVRLSRYHTLPLPCCFCWRVIVRSHCSYIVATRHRSPSRQTRASTSCKMHTGVIWVVVRLFQYENRTLTRDEHLLYTFFIYFPLLDSTSKNLQVTTCASTHSRSP